MIDEHIVGAIKLLLRERLTVEDGEVHINDKKGFAYKVFNIINEYYPEDIQEYLSKYDDYEL